MWDLLLSVWKMPVCQPQERRTDSCWWWATEPDHRCPSHSLLLLGCLKHHLHPLGKKNWATNFRKTGMEALGQGTPNPTTHSLWAAELWGNTVILGHLWDLVKCARGSLKTTAPGLTIKEMYFWMLFTQRLGYWMPESWRTLQMPTCRHCSSQHGSPELNPVCTWGAVPESQCQQ